MEKCKKCGYDKADLVHHENWGEHQRKVEELNPGILKSAIPNAHTFEPIPEEEKEEKCEDCEGTGFFEVGPGDGFDCRNCNATGVRP